VWGVGVDPSQLPVVSAEVSLSVQICQCVPYQLVVTAVPRNGICNSRSAIDASRSARKRPLQDGVGVHFANPTLQTAAPLIGERLKRGY